jgi:hypothetical protein
MAPDDDLAGYFTAEEWLIAKTDTVSWEDVRRALEGISGTLSESSCAAARTVICVES